jgi:hypothetical protein
MPGLYYCTIEDVRDALESKASAYDEHRIGRAIEAATRDVDDTVQQHDGYFRPIIETRYFDWPPQQTAHRWRLWLDGNALLSVSTLVSGGVTIPPTDYFLEPQTYGPPYDRIELDRGGSASFDYTNGTPQRAVAVTGLWEQGDDREDAGALDGAINDSVTALTVTDGSAAGVGDHLIVGDERMIVTAKSWTDSGQNIGADLAVSEAARTVTVTTGSEYTAGELLLVDSERMLVLDVAGNSLMVQRAVDGSVLAAHTAGADVYARRGCMVERGARGSTAASHLDAASVERHLVPGDAHELAVASAITNLLSGRAGYAREYGPQGAGTKLGVGLSDLRERVRSAYGQQARFRTV